MKASFENDPARGPGYGLFRLKELDIPQDDPVFSLRRSGDQLCLAVGDWQEAEERLKPDSFRFEDGGLVLAVSPAIVDRLDPLQIYRLTLFGAASPQRATLELQQICYSPLAQGCAVAEAARPVVKTPEPVAEPPAPPAPPVVETPEQPLNMAQPAPKSSSAPWLIAAGLVLCLAVGGGVWWYMDSSRAAQAEQAEKAAQEKAAAEKAEAEKAAAEKAAAEKAAEEKAAADKVEADKLAQETVAAEKAAQEKAAAEKAAAEKAAAEKAAAEKAEADRLAAEKAAADAAAAEKAAAEKLPVRSAKEQVREFLRGSGTPAEALTLSQQLPTATPDDQDALFLLMEAAAEGGNAQAMLTVARFYNPADASPSGTIIKDAEQAFNWLTKAKAVPETAAEAAKGLDALRGWLQPRAASDAMAKSLLEKMEK